MSFLSRTRQEENNFETMYVLKDGSRFSLELPGGEKGPTRFRPFPSFDDQGNELPMRIARDDGFGNAFYEDSDFHDWIYPEYGVRGAGNKGRFTAFFRMPGSGDMDPSPFRVFWKTLGKAIWDDKEKGGARFPAEWYNFLGSKTDKKIQMEAALKRPSWMILLQGISYGNRGKEYKDYAGNSSPKFPCAYLGSQTTKGSFEEQLNKKKPGKTRAESLDDFLVPDILSCAQGCMLDIALTDVGGRKGYVVNTGPFVPLDVQWTRSQRKPWDQVIRLLTAAEQVNVLCTHFDREAVDFALRGSVWEDLLPNEVRGSWDRLSSGGRPVAGFTPPVAAAQQPSQSVSPAAQVSAPATPRASSYVPAAPAAPAARPSAPVAPFAGAPVKSASTAPVAPFNPSVPPPPSSAGRPTQPAVVSNPIGDATTDGQHVASIKERLAAAQSALSNEGEVS